MFLSLPPNPRERAELEKRIRDLEKKNAFLDEQLQGSFFDARDEVFLKATGFNSAAEAKSATQNPVVWRFSRTKAALAAGWPPRTSKILRVSF
jgi:hypothetical protein